MEIIVIIVAGIGLANALVNEFVFEWARNLLPQWKWLEELTGCLTCMSFWCGLAMGLLFGYGMMSIAIGLCSSIIGRIITIWENK